MSHETWIDRQVREAQRRGLFDNLPGTGKPLSIGPGAADGDYGQAWLRDYAMREGVSAEELLPAPLRLRREAERLAAEVADLPSEDAVREAVSDLNRRIVEWRRFPDGPPIHVRLVNKDEMLARWRESRASSASSVPPPPPERGRCDGDPPRKGRMRRRPHSGRGWMRRRSR
jgi:hypothetical protein